MLHINILLTYGSNAIIRIQAFFDYRPTWSTVKSINAVFTAILQLLTVNAEVTMHFPLFQMIALYCRNHSETYTN
jgi:hypothetical protein